MELPELSREVVIGVAGAAASGLLAWMGWSVKRFFPSHREIAALRKAVSDDLVRMVQRQDVAEAACERRDRELTERLAGLEARLATLPTRDDLHGLQIGLTRIEGRIGAMQARQDGRDALFGRFEHQLDLMDAYLKKVEQ